MRLISLSRPPPCTLLFLLRLLLTRPVVHAIYYLLLLLPSLPQTQSPSLLLQPLLQETSARDLAPKDHMQSSISLRLQQEHARSSRSNQKLRRLLGLPVPAITTTAIVKPKIKMLLLVTSLSPRLPLHSLRRRTSPQLRLLVERWPAEQHTVSSREGGDPR